MISDIFVLEFYLFIIVILFINAINILMTWYLAGIYLIFGGLLLLLDDGDIFIGFLWIIDLGVGLVFFIFIIHLFTFLSQKVHFELYNNFFFFFILFFIFINMVLYSTLNTVMVNFNYFLKKIWFLNISWYDYYEIFYTKMGTDLNLLREIYFYNNNFEFFLINFMALYGIIASILLIFLIKNLLIKQLSYQYNYFNVLSVIHSVFFIRNQNFLKQQYVAIGSRVWTKKKIYL